MQLWDAESGKCYHTFRGHTAEIVCRVSPLPSPDSLQVYVTFNPQSTLVATGSMDRTAKLWDVESGAELYTLSVCHPLRVSMHSLSQGHTAEIICIAFNIAGDHVVTGSFDHTACIWDPRTGRFVVVGYHVM